MKSVLSFAEKIFKIFNDDSVFKQRSSVYTYKEEDKTVPNYFRMVMISL